MVFSLPAGNIQTIGGPAEPGVIAGRVFLSNNTTEMKMYCKKLNPLYRKWIKAIEKEDVLLSGLQHALQTVLAEMKERKIKIALIDFSAIPDFGPYGGAVVEGMAVALTKVRIDKNEAIDKRLYKTALELEEVEKSMRAELNKELARKIFPELTTFYSLGDMSVGYLLSGNPEFDAPFEQTVTRVFRHIPVYGKQLIRKTNERRIDDENEAWRNAA